MFKNLLGREVQFKCRQCGDIKFGGEGSLIIEIDPSNCDGEVFQCLAYNFPFFFKLLAHLMPICIAKE